MLAFVMIAGLAMASAQPTSPSLQDPGDTPLAQRVSQIETCLSAAEPGEASSCIGVFSKPCRDTPQGQGTVGMTACLGAEAEAWEALMVKWLDQAKTADDMTDEGRSSLIAGQSAWETGRKDSITVYAGRQGTVYRIIAAQWWLDWTARRALWLNDLAVGPVG